MNIKNYIKMYAGALVIMFLFCTTALQGDTLDLKRALGMAYENNPTINMYKQEASTRVLGIKRDIYTKLLPKVDIGYERSLSYKVGHALPYVDLKDDRDGLSVNARYNLFSFGSSFMGLSSGSKRIKQSAYKLESERHSFIIKVLEAYMDMLCQTQSLKVREKMWDAAKRGIESARAKFELGYLAKSDLEDADSQYYEAIALRESQESILDLSRMTLADLLCIDVQEIGDLQEPEPVDKLPTTFGEFIDIVMKNNPSLKHNQLSREIEKTNILNSLTEGLPSVDLKLSASPNSLRDARLGDWGARASISVNMSLFAQGSNILDFMIARSKSKSGEMSYEIGVSKLKQTAFSLWNTLANEKNSGTYMRKSRSASMMSLDYINHEYSNGDKTILDVIAGQKKVYQTDLDMINSRKKYLVAMYSALALMGRLQYDSP